MLSKVIDFHAHIGTVENWTTWVTEFFEEHNPVYIERFGKNITPEAVISFFQSQGVDRTVMLAEYNPVTSGVVTNEYTAEFCRGHRELIPFGAVCLYDGTPYGAQAENALKGLGMKGFKLIPSYAHFYPNDEKLFPFYEVAQSANVPVMFHTGISSFKRSRIKYADPLLLDDVADAFPDLTIVMEHGGRSFWYDRASWLITRHRNMYVGIAGIPVRKLLRYFPNFDRYQDRFIFGSDWPGVADIRQQIERVYKLEISDDAKEKILWKNAEAILGIR
ncbi:MAG TPA: amidohydrolase family protein [Syntrophorhabdaceae bacterium]|nr:amidohydrolase family protein [Syntrophorhabdaceae bacterium]HNT67770.1 amidohydrolase family protein [Syntrophorhabdaceae bacterium]